MFKSPNLLRSLNQLQFLKLSFQLLVLIVYLYSVSKLILIVISIWYIFKSRCFSHLHILAVVCLTAFSLQCNLLKCTKMCYFIVELQFSTWVNRSHLPLFLVQTKWVVMETLHLWWDSLGSVCTDNGFLWVIISCAFCVHDLMRCHHFFQVKKLARLIWRPFLSRPVERPLRGVSMC